jgi:hypothetical protein
MALNSNETYQVTTSNIPVTRNKFTALSEGYRNLYNLNQRPFGDVPRVDQPGQPGYELQAQADIINYGRTLNSGYGIEATRRPQWNFWSDAS